MFRKLLFFCALVILASCQPELTRDFSFLEGSWKMKTSDSTYLLENWKKTDEQHYNALNYIVSDSSGMVLSEEIEIEITDTGTYYKPTIEGINGGRPFMYKFISQDDKKYVFENKEYEFPRKIWYKVIDANNMQAGIENEAGDKKETFIFEKVNQ